MERLLQNLLKFFNKNFIQGQKKFDQRKLLKLIFKYSGGTDFKISRHKMK